MHIFFTGATGLIGRHLCPFLLHHHDVTVLSRNPTKAKVLLGHQVNAIDSLEDVDFNTVDVVINLAGEPIVNKRWSNKQKAVIRDSRIIVTQAISDAIKQCHTRHILLYLAVQLVIMVDKATLWLMKTIQSLMMNLATNCAKIGSKQL